MNAKSVISGDIIAFTSLSDHSKSKLEEELFKLFNKLNQEYNTYSRLVKGDYIEIAIPKPEHALRIALLLKTFVKSFEFTAKTKRYKYFEEYGVRLVIGYGELSRFDPSKGIIDGEAIYLSGRRINEESTHTKERVVIKNSLLFVSGNTTLNQSFEAVMALLDFILARATQKQSEVAYYKILGMREDEISSILGTSQSAVNQHSNAIGYNAIEKAILYFENTIKSQ